MTTQKPKRGVKNPLYYNAELFIEAAHKVHGNLYDYSNIELKGSAQKIEITCKRCGNVFMQRPGDHLAGNGCPDCGRIKQSVCKKKDINHFLTEIKQKRNDHGEFYDYSNVIYEGMNKKVEIICPKHGPFWQTPLNHIQNHNCPECGKINYKEKRTLTTEEFLDRAQKNRSDSCSVYDYSKVVYKGNSEKIEIICPKHGSFWQNPKDHAHKNSGCPICNSSHLEEKTRWALTDLGIKFEFQKRFDWLGKQSLDFYLPDYNIALECQGIQHYEQVEAFGNTLKEIQTRDKYKYRKCKLRGVQIRYIKYDTVDIRAKIKKLLNK